MLVALLVLSVGMLGVGVLMVHGLRSTRAALLRTQAVNLASDLADRIRANASAREAYDLAAHGGEPAQHDCAPGPAGGGRNCRIAELAEDDLARWLQAVRESLPAGTEGPARAEVEYLAADPGAPERWRIALVWHEPGESAPFSYQVIVILMPRRAPGTGGH